MTAATQEAFLGLVHNGGRRTPTMARSAKNCPTKANLNRSQRDRHAGLECAERYQPRIQQECPEGLGKNVFFLKRNIKKARIGRDADARVAVVLRRDHANAFYERDVENRERKQTNGGGGKIREGGAIKSPRPCGGLLTKIIQWHRVISAAEM